MPVWPPVDPRVERCGLALAPASENLKNPAHFQGVFVLGSRIFQLTKFFLGGNGEYFLFQMGGRLKSTVTRWRFHFFCYIFIPKLGEMIYFD